MSLLHEQVPGLRMADHRSRRYDSEQESAETEVFYMLSEGETTWTGTNADGYIISVTGMNDEKTWIIKITAPEELESDAGETESIENEATESITE